MIVVRTYSAIHALLPNSDLLQDYPSPNLDDLPMDAGARRQQDAQRCRSPDTEN